MLFRSDTIYVTMEDMIHHTRAVTRGAKRAFVIADMPYLSYHCDINEAVKNAGRLIQEGQGGIRAGRLLKGEIELNFQEIYFRLERFWVVFY